MSFATLTAGLAATIVAWCLAAAIVVQAADVPVASTGETLLGTVLEFTATQLGPYGRGHLDVGRWNDDFRRDAPAWSRLDVIEEAGRRGLRVQILDETIFSRGRVTLLRLTPYYPPEADVVRLRLRVVSGRVRAFAGGPTAYFGNSDVYTRTEETAIADRPQASVLDLRLHHPLRRNFRRSGFSTDAARNYYNRWAQEPLGIFLDAGTHGEFVLESVELLHRGEGKPFATFADSDVQRLQAIADFENARAVEPFTLFMADGEAEWFEQSWKREKPLRFEPPKLAVVADRVRGGNVLEAVGASAEEVHCAGLRTIGSADANAIRFAAYHDAPEYRNTLVGVGRAEALDVLVFAAPATRPLAWTKFAASDELRAQGGPGFDYQFTYRTIRDRNDVDFAIYHARRYVAPKQWTTLTIPTADFVCVYACGALRDRFLGNTPLRSEEIAAVAWLNPWCRVGRGNTPVTLRLDDFEYVRVPGSADEHRSFPQVLEPASIRWLDGEWDRQRMRTMLLPGDDAPAGVE